MKGFLDRPIGNTQIIFNQIFSVSISSIYFVFFFPFFLLIFLFHVLTVWSLSLSLSLSLPPSRPPPIYSFSALAACFLFTTVIPFGLSFFYAPLSDSSLSFNFYSIYSVIYILFFWVVFLYFFPHYFRGCEIFYRNRGWQKRGNTWFI